MRTYVPYAGEVMKICVIPMSVFTNIASPVLKNGLKLSQNVLKSKITSIIHSIQTDGNYQKYSLPQPPSIFKIIGWHLLLWIIVHLLFKSVNFGKSCAISIPFYMTAFNALVLFFSPSFLQNYYFDVVAPGPLFLFKGIVKNICISIFLI